MRKLRQCPGEKRNEPSLARLLLTVALLVLATTACSGSSDLDILRSDPLAQVELPGAVESRMTEMEGGTALGIDSPGQIQHTFVMPQGQFDAAIESLATMARQAGWQLQPRNVVGYSGEKNIDGHFAQVEIAGTADTNTVWVLIYTRGN